jgi:hypothetical protein
VPEPPAEPVLYCPTCGYNLTGLPDNRCPECGDAFSRLDLEEEYRLAAQPVRAREWFLHLFGIPLLFWLCLGVLAGLSCFQGAWVMVVSASVAMCIAVLFVMAFANAFQFSSRILARYEYRRGMPIGAHSGLSYYLNALILVTWTTIVAVAPGLLIPAFLS